MSLSSAATFDPPSADAFGGAHLHRQPLVSSDDASEGVPLGVDEVLRRLGAEPGANRAGGERPAFFGPTNHPLFGWYHPPVLDQASATLAVLLCGPHGAEEPSAHRSLRVLAQGLADDGLPVLRFDADGVGNASGDDLDPSRVAAWLSSIEHALQALQQASGCAQAAVVGVQLGALLSAQLLRRHPEIVAWIGVAPVASGRQFLRERLALGHLSDGSGQSLLEAGGFAYTQPTREALGPLLLDVVTQAPASTTLVVYERDDLPLPPRVHQALGPRVAWQAFGGYARMVDEPHFNAVPLALVAALRARLRDLAAAPERPCAVPGPPFGRTVASWDGVIEQPVHWGGPTSTPAFGLLTLPTHGRIRRSVLFVNAGAVRHVGASRLYARLARRWAARGALVLRIDLRGLGDSPAAPGLPAQVVYGETAVADVVEAAQWLARLSGVPRAQLVGLCSGAYHGLQAAWAGAPVRQVVAINPLTFFHAPGAPVAAGQGAHLMSTVGEALARGWRSESVWRRLATGQLPWHRVAPRVWHYARWRVGRALQAAVCAATRWSGLPRRDDLVAQLQGLVARGVQMDFVFAEGEPGPGLLAHHAAGCVARLRVRDALRIDTVPHADHTFTTHASRQRLDAVLDQLMSEPAAGHVIAPHRARPLAHR